MGIRWLAMALALSAGPALAGSVVHFSDGRAMRVEGVESTAGVVRLTLEGGGSLELPARRVVRWGEIADPRPASPDDEPADGPEDDPWRAAAGSYAQLIGAAATRYDLDPALLTAVAEVESAFDPSALSPKGACGLMQLMPQTAARFGVHDVFDAEQNLEGGARYLSWLLDRFDGDSELALAGYNAGEAAVERHRGVPPYDETRNYVQRVLRGAGRLAPLAP